MNTKINNENFTFEFESGVIAGYSKNIINNTYSSGGGGVFVNGNYHIVPPSIYTESYPQIDFFLKKVNQEEKEISLVGHDLKLRDGHKVSLVWGRKTNAPVNYLISIYNHDTERHQFITNEGTLELLGLTSKKISLPLLVNIIIFFIPLGWIFLIGNFIRNKIISKNRVNIISEINNTLLSFPRQTLLD